MKFTEHGRIALQARLEQNWLDISVSDTGIGIRPEDQESVFLPFRQVDAGPARRQEGTGLGLAICRRLAELLGGTIQLHSEPGRGSTFHLTLPAKISPAPPPPSDSHPLGFPA